MAAFYSTAQGLRYQQEMGRIQFISRRRALATVLAVDQADTMLPQVFVLQEEAVRLDLYMSNGVNVKQ